MIPCAQGRREGPPGAGSCGGSEVDGKEAELDAPSVNATGIPETLAAAPFHPPVTHVDLPDAFGPVISTAFAPGPRYTSLGTSAPLPPSPEAPGRRSRIGCRPLTMCSGPVAVNCGRTARARPRGGGLGASTWHALSTTDGTRPLQRQSRVCPPGTRVAPYGDARGADAATPVNDSSMSSIATDSTA